MIAAAATLLVVACSKNDTFKSVDTEDAVIGFGYSASENTTRALANQELTMDWFHEIDNAFGVYGYKSSTNIFKNEKVWLESKTETPGANDTWTSEYKWKHTTIRFWDKAQTTAYSFYAYAPFAGTNNSTEGANPTFNTTTGFTFTGLNTIENIKTAGADKAVATGVENIGWGDSRLDANHSNSPTVQFVFSHILSKLSFKIKTDIKRTDDAVVADRVATFTVTAIDIDFPSATSVQWAETAKAAVAGTTTYDTYAVKDGTFETSVFSGTQEVTNSAVAIGETFIVTPVNGTVTKHEFDVQVTYNIAYADGTSETGCVATGTIGTGTAPNIYTPAQNQYYIATINIDPAKIEFCVEGVNAWNPVTEPDPVDVE